MQLTMIKDILILIGIFEYMTSSPPSSIDSEQFKTEQRQRWDSVAEGWKEWWQTVEVAAQKVSDRLVELAQIKPGQKVLDIATGIGEPAITAARKLAGSSNNIDGTGYRCFNTNADNCKTKSCRIGVAGYN